MSTDTQQDEEFILDADPSSTTRDDTLETIAAMQRRIEALTESMTGQGERINGLVDDLTEARRGRQQAETNLERFKEMVVEIGGKYAEQHDMCSVYDDAMEEMGLPRRPREYTIEIDVFYRQRVTVMARSEEDAAEQIENATQLNYLTFPVPLDGIESNADYVQDLHVKVHDGEPAW